MSRPKYSPGTRTMSLKNEERIALLKWAKTLKPENEFEKRIAKRFLCKLIGDHRQQHRAPALYPPQECPVCERAVSGIVFNSHVIRCKERQKIENQKPQIDPVVWEMVQ